MGAIFSTGATVGTKHSPILREIKSLSHACKIAYSAKHDLSPCLLDDSAPPRKNRHHRRSVQVQQRQVTLDRKAAAVVPVMHYPTPLLCSGCAGARPRSKRCR